jgi:hypothetical protein
LRIGGNAFVELLKGIRINDVNKGWCFHK